MANGGGSSVRSLADDIKALGLDRYLLDTAVVDQAAADLAAWLQQETSLPVPRAVVRVGCRLVSAALLGRLNRGADRAITGGLAVAVSAFERLPGADRFCAALRNWARTKAADAEAKAQLDELLEGRGREIDRELLPTLSTDLRFQLQQVGKLDGVRDQLTAGFAQLLERLNPQPQLDPKLVELTQSSRLYFGARKVPFVGREAELKRLLRFTVTRGDVAWWLVTGPGGMGKSRLALELCHRAGACWRTGFLPQQQLEHFDWANWQPDLPHLLIVDYAAALPKAVGRMLEALRLRQHNTKLEMPVRVLLLERRQDDRWWDELMAAGDRHGLAEVLVDQAPLELGPLGPDGIWSMVAKLGGDAAKTLGRDSALQRLTEIDPAMRPLFAALAGEALDAGADLRQWTRTDLLDDWLKREREKHWQPAGVDEPHANLAALATMVGGIAEDILEAPPDGIELPRPEAVSAAAYAALTGRQPVVDAKGTTRFAALEPDLLGSFFVLEHLRAPMGRAGVMPNVVKSWADSYRRAAWNRDRSDALAFALFLLRSKDDFPGHPAFAALLGPPAGSKWSHTLWAMLVVDLIDAIGAAGRIDKAEALLTQLRTLAEGHPDEPELWLPFAKGSVNLISHMGSAGRIDEAEALLSRLRTLAEGHPGEPELRLPFAQGSFNLINALRAAERIDEAEALLGRLRTLTKGHPGEPELRRLFTRGSFNLIGAMGSAGRIDEAAALLAQLRTLADDHPDEPELRLPIAQGSVYLIRAMGSTGRIEDAKALLVRLRKLAEDHPDEPELRLECAAGSVNLIGGMCSAGRIDEAEALLARLRTLAEGHPDERELRLECAKGSFNLIVGMGSAGRIDEAAALVGQLRTLAERHPDELPVLAAAGLAVVEVLLAHGAREDLEGARAMARSAEGLLRHPAVIAELRQLFGGDRAGQLEGLIEALLSDG